MNEEDLKVYHQVRDEKAVGYKRQKRGWIEVSGKEAVQFLNGLITNDVAKLEDGAQMSAAFPNVQGRLLAMTRVRRAGDKFLFETEEATREKIFQNLFRFTFAGDFFVEDLSDKYEYFEVQNLKAEISNQELIAFDSKLGKDFFVPQNAADAFFDELKKQDAVELSPDVYEVLRIEAGLPLYGIDMDESTVVLETGLDEAVSFNKGCYIGQEIIARIHFRGHVAKKLAGVIFEDADAAAGAGDELKSAEGKNAGKITSVTYSPQFGKRIALAYVRWDYLAEGTELRAGEAAARVKNLPFIEK